MRHEAASRIAARAHAILEGRLAPGDAIALYRSKGSEVETSAIDADARARGLIVAYPRVIGARALAFHAAGLAELVPGPFGLLEPPATAPAIELSAIRAFIIPGIAFDRAGGRIGWGKGYYDATLAAAPVTALRVGLAYECQLIDRVAREPHDVALHIILTEAATHVVA